MCIRDSCTTYIRCGGCRKGWCGRTEYCCIASLATNNRWCVVNDCDRLSDSATLITAGIDRSPCLSSCVASCTCTCCTYITEELHTCCTTYIRCGGCTVSYTHLTLPTSDLV